MVQTQTGPVTTEAERYLIIYMSAVLLIITAMVIIIFVVYQKRKNKLIAEKQAQEKRFAEELLKTQTEIQEQTLKNIAWELHDNVGQLLAFANMQLNGLKALASDTMKEKIADANNLVKDGLEEVRLLSKSLNNEVVLNQGFIKTLENELTRLQKMKFDEAILTIDGEPWELSIKNHEIILFRIIQEFLSNTVKYADADTLKINLDYRDNELIITASDNGKGFLVEQVEKGAGLITIESRAELINAQTDLSSRAGEGTKLVIRYPRFVDEFVS